MMEKFIGESGIRAVLVNRLTKDSEDPESDVPPEVNYTITVDIQYMSNKLVTSPKYRALSISTIT